MFCLTESQDEKITKEKRWQNDCILLEQEDKVLWNLGNVGEFLRLSKCGCGRGRGYKYYVHPPHTHTLNSYGEILFVGIPFYQRREYRWNPFKRMIETNILIFFSTSNVEHSNLIGLVKIRALSDEFISL